MRIKQILLLLVIISFSTINLHCDSDNKTVTQNIVTNDKPLYQEGTFVNLEKLYSIELISESYEISRIQAMDTDNQNNLYALGAYERAIIVFDEKGKFLRTMGRRGQGPQELEAPIDITVFNGNIYIVEGFNGVKIWDLQGEYIEKKIIPANNYEKILPSQNGFFMLSIDIPNYGIKWIYKLSISENDLKNKKYLFKYELDRNTEFYFDPPEVLAFAGNGNFYFPESSDKFSLVLYDSEGQPVQSFGRKYSRKPFTNHARESYQLQFGNAILAGKLSDLPKYPPVIRKVLLDSRENIWIMSGEIDQDLLGHDENVAKSTIDIFNSDGIWLYSFESNQIESRSIINNDRLYTISKISHTDGQQYINVYKINYNY